MNPSAKKVLASVLSVALAWTSFPQSALAEDQKGQAKKGPKPRAVQEAVSTDEALAFLKAHGIFKGGGDEMRGYLVNGDSLSPMGEVLYKYLKLQANPGEEAQALEQSLDHIRKSGSVTGDKRKAIQKKIDLYNEKFGALDEAMKGDGAGENTFRFGTLREAMMTEAAVVDSEKRKYNQVETENGWEFWDKEGLAFRLNKQEDPKTHKKIGGAQTYNRDLQKNQHLMNQGRPPEAPPIPETGRYNYQMLQYSYWRLADQLSELEKSYRIDRMVNMAELLGRQLKGDKFFLDATLEADLVAAAKAKSFSPSLFGKSKTVLEIVDDKLKGRRSYLDGMEGVKGAYQAVDTFKTDMEKFKSMGDSITEANVKSMQLDELYSMRMLSLVFLETQRFHAKSQLERLDPDSPDSDIIKKMINESTMDKATREKYEQKGQGLRRRVDRAIKVINQVQAALLGTYYAASLDLVQSALNQCDKDIREIGLDYTLYAELPSASYLASTQLEGISLKNLGGWLKKAYARSGIDSEHSKNMDQINAMLPQYEMAEKAIAEGSFVEARKLIIAMSPDAVEHERDFSPKQSSVRITDAIRISSVLKESREVLAKVAKTNQMLDTAGNFATWTVGLAVGAGVLSRTFGVVAKLASSFPAKWSEPWLWGVMPSPFKVVEEVAIHARDRLNSLAPAPENLRRTNMVMRYLEVSGCRLVSATGRQAGFSFLSGGISGTFTLIAHLKDEYLPQAEARIPFTEKSLMKFGQHSNFENSKWGALDAFATGFKGGVAWGNQEFMPALGYIGLPSTSFEGTVWAKAGQVIGERGLFGSLSVGAKGLATKARMTFAEDTTGGFLARLSKRGLAGKGAAFTLGMTDNIVKYAVFNDVVGGVAEQASWWKNYDEPDLERRIKRAQNTGMNIMQDGIGVPFTGIKIPLWLAIPVFPAKYEAAASEYQNSIQGVEQYKVQKLEYKLANAGPETRLPMGKPKVPFSQAFFNLRFRGEPKETTFTVPKEARREAISNTLVEVLSGGKEGAVAKDINPLEFLRVSQLPETETVGDKLHMSDEVAVEARNKFAEALRKNPKLTEQVLDAKLGSHVGKEGEFGVVSPKVRNEVALSVYLEKAEGRKVAKPLFDKAEALLKDYLKSNTVTKGFAEDFLKAERTLSAGKDQHPAVDKAADELVQDVQNWIKESGKVSYQDFVKAAREKAEAKRKSGQLDEAEYLVFKTMYDYVDSIETRFNSFNNVETVSRLSKEMVDALKVEYKGNAGVSKVLDIFTEKLDAWDTAHKTDREKTYVEGPRSDRSFENTISLLDQCLGGGQGCGQIKISNREMDVLKKALKDMRSSAWVLHDAKGGALPGWRPVQFEGLMTSLAYIAKQGKGGQPIRQFIMLTTGGGKTMLTFEGLLPLAEADAAHHGMKDVMFLTVQANLEAQAHLEFIAYKKIGSKLKFETYEGLKSKIAQGFMYRQKVAEDTWILGDEMDGAALQPMLTIGEVSARVVKAGSVYHLVDRISDHIQMELGKNASELAESVRTHARRAQTALEALDARSPEGLAARRTTDGLLKAADELGKATEPDNVEAIKDNIRELLAQQQAIVDSKPLLLQAKSMEAATRTVLEFLKVSDQLDQAREKRANAKTDKGKAAAEAKIGKLEAQKQAMRDAAPMILNTSVEALEKLSGELEAAESEAGSPAQAEKVKGEIRDLLLGQQSLLDSAGLSGSVQGKALKSASNSLKAKLSQAGPGKGADLVRQSVRTQRSALGTDTAIEGEQIKAVTEAGRRILEKLSEKPQPPKTPVDYAKAFGQQKNLLNLISDIPEARIKALREMARDIRVEAERRYNASLREYARDLRVEAEKLYREAAKADAKSPALDGLKEKVRIAKEFEADVSKLAEGKPSAEIEKRYEALSKGGSPARDLASLKEDIRIAEEFESGEPALTAKREQARQARDEASGQLKALDEAWDRLYAQTKEAEKNGSPTVEGLKADMKKLEGKIQAAQARYSSFVEALKPTRADLDYARAAFAKNGAEILDVIAQAKPGWEGRATELMSTRRRLLESFAYGENPIYTVYRQMKQDVYSTANSVARKSDDARVLFQVLREASKVTGEQSVSIDAVAKTLKQIGESEGPAKAEAQKLLAKIDELKAGVAEGEKTLLGQAKKIGKGADGSLVGTSFAEGQEAIGRAKERIALVESGLKAVRQAGGLSAEAQAALDAAIAEAGLRGQSLKSKGDRLNATADQAAQIWNNRIDGASLSSLILKWGKNKVFSLFGGKQEVLDVGLSRLRAMELLKAVVSDPLMSASQQQNLVMDIFTSVLWPRGITGKGNSYVRREMINMARGYFENPATIRMDNLTHNINVVHNGQWFESMDNPGRRWWELEYGTDLTLPYKNGQVSTIKDITVNKKTRYISLSGTAEQEFQEHLRENGTLVGGTPSEAPANVKLDIRSGPSETFSSIKEALVSAKETGEGMVIVKPNERGVPLEVKKYVDGLKSGKKDEVSVKISDAPEGAVRDYLEGLRKNQGGTSLVVLSLSDTKVLKSVRRYLIKTGLAAPDEIASVFAGAEELRQHRHEAKIQQQLNLNGLDKGKIKILMLDTRVGGRGLDLNFKGDRDNTDPKAFRGYTNFKMLIIGPNEMSSVHLLQSEGRIDVGRVFPGAAREFSLVMDVRAAQDEVIFKRMIDQDEFFAAMRADPAFREHMAQSGRSEADADWSSYQSYFDKLGSEVAQAELAGKGDDVAAQAELLKNYQKAVNKYLKEKQLEVAKDQLRQANVKEDSAAFDPKLRGLDLAR